MEIRGWNPIRRDFSKPVRSLGGSLVLDFSDSPQVFLLLWFIGRAPDIPLEISGTDRTDTTLLLIEKDDGGKGKCPVQCPRPCIFSMMLYLVKQQPCPS